MKIEMGTNSVRATGEHCKQPLRDSLHLTVDNSGYQPTYPTHIVHVMAITHQNVLHVFHSTESRGRML